MNLKLLIVTRLFQESTAIRDTEVQKDLQKFQEERTCCGEVPAFLEQAHVKDNLGDFAFAFGNADGPCCVIEGGLQRSSPVVWFSSSKWVTSYALLSLIDRGLASLETPVADVLEWWTHNDTDPRSRVTLRHLMAQTDAMDTFGGGLRGLMRCNATDMSVLGCAREAYDKTFRGAHEPGTVFTYSETSFFVMGAVIMKLTDMSSWNAAFQKALGHRISSEVKYEFPEDFASIKMVGDAVSSQDPGAAFQASLDDFSKFLQAVFAKSLVSPSLVAEAERPQTIAAMNSQSNSRMPARSLFGKEFIRDMRWHYGFGEWLECESEECTEPVPSSAGFGGTLPWIQRHGPAPYWGLLARFKPMSLMNKEFWEIYADLKQKLPVAMQAE